MMTMWSKLAFQFQLSNFILLIRFAFCKVRQKRIAIKTNGAPLVLRLAPVTHERILKSM
jgi:hypothetical protein